MQAHDLRIWIVAARFNPEITTRLLDGALAALQAAGARAENISVVRVPGAFDLPPVVRQVANAGRADAIVALGAVVRGETAHFEYVAGQCAAGLARVADDTAIPVSFGVLTTDTEAQALERAGGEEGNRGADAARVAIELANLGRQIREQA